MRAMASWGFVCLVVLPSLVLAAPAGELVTGTKYPNSKAEGRKPVRVSVLAFNDQAEHFEAPGYRELIPYVLRSPDQDEAGSCLYMSLTGIAEMWMARKNPRISRRHEGPLDLSERFMMNIANDISDNAGVENWKTDSIYLFNAAKKAPRNTQYRFTKGWFTENEEGEYVKARPRAKGAEFGTQYNWIDERQKLKKAKLVKLPKFRREVLFADPESDQWNTGVMPDDIIERIKSTITKNRAPVHIIYNHFGYWHAAFIVGFDDSADNRNCQFVHKFLDYMKNPTNDDPDPQPEPVPLAKPQQVLKRTPQEIYEKTKEAYDRGGGCHPKGVFFVRDSIYADKSGPVYHYDPNNPKARAPYTKKLVMLEYDWVRYMANHAVMITADVE